MQAVPSIGREGLPYWILWFLLCIILLLLAFIFLRDKELRLRVNEFLSGAKRRVKRTQLRIRLNREKRKKADLLRELGEKAWADKLPDEKYRPFINHLEQLEKKDSELRAELNGILSRITDLQKKQEEARQIYKQLEKRKEAGERPDSHEVHLAKEEEKSLKNEIRERQKKIKTGQDALKIINGQKTDELSRLGALIDKDRPEHKNLLGLYVQIDKLNRNILHYMSEIEKFS